MWLDAIRPPGRGSNLLYVPQLFIAKPLPPIEAVASSTLAAAEGEPDDPNDKEYGRCYPQKMHCKSSSKKNQHEQERENQYH